MKKKREGGGWGRGPKCGRGEERGGGTGTFHPLFYHHRRREGREAPHLKSREIALHPTGDGGKWRKRGMRGNLQTFDVGFDSAV
jgi:hypothetical protein